MNSSYPSLCILDTLQRLTNQTFTLYISPFEEKNYRDRRTGNNFQRRMSRFPCGWRTQRNAIRDANRRDRRVIQPSNAPCALSAPESTSVRVLPQFPHFSLYLCIRRKWTLGLSLLIDFDNVTWSATTTKFSLVLYCWGTYCYVYTGESGRATVCCSFSWNKENYCHHISIS
jgi:hypothetical protein